MRVFIPLFLLIAGCDSPPYADMDVALASFSPLQVHATQSSVEIVLGAKQPAESSGPCPIASADVSARLGGVSARLMSRGGRVGTSPGDDVDDNLCGPVRLQLDVPPPEGPSVLEISDSTATRRCQLPDLKAVRAATPVAPGADSREWKAGQQVSLQWSPRGDLALWARVTASLAHLNTANEIDDLIEIAGVVRDGDVVRFTVPSVSPGSYVLDLASSPQARCEGEWQHAELSSSITRFGSWDPVTIVP